MSWLENLVSYAQECLGERERERLYLRGVSDHQVDLFRLGYLEEDPPFDGCPSHFLSWWGNHRWQLTDSLVFPLTTTLGEIRGLQFRSVNPARKGYIDYFASKEEVALFGLHQAMPSIWETGSVWLVEGAFDLFPIQRHIPQVICTLHAGISSPLWRVLRRVANQICLAWDADGSGRKAAYNILKSDKASAFDIKIVKFPNVPYQNGLTKDPNELWSAWGDGRLGVFLSQQLDFSTGHPLNI